MNTTENQTNKQTIWDFWQQLEHGQGNTIPALFDSVMMPDTRWHGPDPINNLQGPQSVATNFWQPLMAAFPDLKRKTYLFFGGASNGRKDGNADKDGRMWVTGTGHFIGTFTQDYLGLPANGAKIQIRWGEFYRMAEGKILEVYCLLDFVDLIAQLGLSILPPILAQDSRYLPPAASDGILLAPQVRAHSDYTREHIWRFIYQGLNAYDETNLESMGVAAYFRPDIAWYGPGGIGSCYGLREFEDFHQKPWLHAFPDREVQDLQALIGEGDYSGGPGWAGVKATHKGEYKGVSATGNAISVNGLDWWKRDGEQLIENWVFVDMVHLFRQLGVDLFERAREQATSSI